MLLCMDCGEAYHTYCVNARIPADPSAADRFRCTWRCPNCKICEVCGDCKEEQAARLLELGGAERGEADGKHGQWLVVPVCAQRVGGAAVTPLDALPQPLGAERAICFRLQQQRESPDANQKGVSVHCLAQRDPTRLNAG